MMLGLVPTAPRNLRKCVLSLPNPCSLWRNVLSREQSGHGWYHPAATAPSPMLHIPVPTVKCIMWRRTDHFFFSLGQEKMSSLKMAGIFLIFEMSHFALFFFISGRGETVNLCVKFSYYHSTDEKIIEFLFLSSGRLGKSEFHSPK